MNRLTVKSPAKVNLVLEVIGKRDDGYHNIRSLVQTVDLFDVITFENSNTFMFSCTESSLQTDDNLIVRAVNLLKKEINGIRNVRIELIKRIPWAAGLGGGSSNAAMALLAVNRLSGEVCPRDKLTEIAARLGSDVPYFLSGGLAMIEGKGDIVKPLPDLSSYWIVLMIPPLHPISNKTGTLYSLLNTSHYSQEHLTSDVVTNLLRNKKIDCRILFNTFEHVAFHAFHGLEDYWKIFQSSGARHVHLSGSGPALFSIYKDKSEAEQVGGILSERGLIAYVVQSINKGVLISA